MQLVRISLFKSWNLEELTFACLIEKNVIYCHLISCSWWRHKTYFIKWGTFAHIKNSKRFVVQIALRPFLTRFRLLTRNSFYALSIVSIFVKSRDLCGGSRGGSGGSVEPPKLNVMWKRITNTWLKKSEPTQLIK